MKTRVFNFNLPNDLRDYLKKRAADKHTTMSNYLIQIINDDKNDYEEDNGVFTAEEEKPYESKIIKIIADKYFQNILFTDIDATDIEKELSGIILKFTNIVHLVKCKKEKGVISAKIGFKCEGEGGKFRVLNVDVIPSGVVADEF